MKQILYFFFACLALVSCSAFDDDYFTEHRNQAPEHEINKFQVTQKSAEYFARKVSFDDSITRRVVSVEPLAQGRDTLLYIVNFADNRGWLVLSGDKRTEAVLASSQTGRFDKNNLGGAAMWMNDLASKIYGIKQVNPQDTTAVSYRNWCNIDTLALELRKVSPKSLQIRAQTEDDDFNEEEECTDYVKVLIDTKIKLISTKKVAPLIKTKWGQKSPWNDCVPFWQNSRERCPTGCVAVAGAQMLYYFHYLKNTPAYTFGRGACAGAIWDKHNKSYAFRFEDVSSNAWDKMAKKRPFPVVSTDSTRAVSVLMGYVGSKIDMDYGKEGSSAHTEDLLKLYRDNGIQAELCPYDYCLVKKSLDQQLPVNVRAYTGKKNKKILFIHLYWDYLNGHSWIIDGYKEVSSEYTYTYQKAPRSKLVQPFPEEENSQNPKDNNSFVKPPRFREPIVKEVSTGCYTAFYMNWGWDGSYDNGEYTIMDDFPWEAGGYSFNTKREIIHNFKF